MCIGETLIPGVAVSSYNSTKLLYTNYRINVFTTIYVIICLSVSIIT